MELTNKSCLNLQKEHLMSNYMQANIFDYINTENHTVDSDVYSILSKMLLKNETALPDYAFIAITAQIT